MQVIRRNGHRWLSLAWRCMLFAWSDQGCAGQSNSAWWDHIIILILCYVGCHGNVRSICVFLISFRYVWLRGNRHVASWWFPVVCGNRHRMFHLFAPLTPNLGEWYGFNFTAISYVLFRYFTKIPVYWYIQIISLFNFHWDRDKLTNDGKCELSRL